MTIHRGVTTIALIVVVSAAWVAARTGQETTAQTSQDAAAALEQKVAAMLVNKLGPDATTIRVVVEKGSKVMLIGTATRRSTQELAKEVALFVPGVEKVRNKVEFVPPPEGNIAEQAVETTGEETSDSALETSVKYQLQREIGKTTWKIEVEAVEGVVSLRGTVPDQARYDIALKTAKSVNGVKQVIDLLRVAE
jgi:osmotically-inducible protein OsmY